jgi:hypothetical protein
VKLRTPNPRLLPLSALVVVLGAGCSPSSGSTDAGDGAPAATRSAALRFADCMRTNGIKDFPDPDSSGTYTADGIANNSKVDTTSAAWTKAVTACQDLQPAGFTGTKRSAAQQAAAIKFAQCIRENGVPDFPDPEPDGPLVDTNRIPSSNSKAGMAAINAGMKECGQVYAGQLGLPK